MSTQVHHAEPGFIQKYFWSTDHKIIAMQYLFTGMAMALIGGFLAYVFRMQLGFPNHDVPGLRNRNARKIQCVGHHARQHHDFLGGHAHPDRGIR